MDWARHKDHWPHAKHSHFYPAGSLGGCWHVQIMGTGPDLLLLHGAGGATQSWRNLMPILAQRYRCIAVDLPGQGFSRPRVPGRYGLDPLAKDIASLAWSEGWRPVATVGHSAGGALALRLAEEGVAHDGTVIGINAALGTFEGHAGWAFPLAAKLMALNPLTAVLFSRATASRATVRKLIESTGSSLDEEGLRLYQALVGSTRHVDGTLRMMAAWQLEPLLARLPRLTTRTVLLAGTRDRTVPPVTSQKAAARLPSARYVPLEGLGHLAHEEAAEKVAGHVLDALGAEVESR